MSAPPQRPRPSPEQRRALELLTGSRDGVNEELLVYGHGFTRRMLAALVGAGLVTERCEVIMLTSSSPSVLRGKKAVLKPSR
jgi:hypothetical protein